MMSARKNADIPKSRYTKAGIVLSGDINGVKHVVAPYTEGRFGDNQKYYVLAKGAIDPGEDVLDGALREASEETGIDMQRLLGADNIAALKRGEAVEHVESGYEGVRIKRFAPQALELNYLGREDNKNRAMIFTLEVEGLEHLQGALKNQRNLSSRFGRAQGVTHPVRTDVARNSEFPSYAERIDWIRQMRIPGEYTRNGEDVKLVPKGYHGPQPENWFRNRENSYQAIHGRHKQKIDEVSDWQSFQSHLTLSDYSTLRDLTEQVKKELKITGLLGGDNDLIKMDTKDSPLSFYQEGADILTMDAYLDACLYSGMDRKDFAKAFCGNTPIMSGTGVVADETPHVLRDIVDQGGGRNARTARAAKEARKLTPASRIERMGSSQLAGVVWAAGEASIDRVAKNIHEREVHSPQDNQWLGGTLYDDSLRNDLHTVYGSMVKAEKPSLEIIRDDAIHMGHTTARGAGMAMAAE